MTSTATSVGQVRTDEGARPSVTVDPSLLAIIGSAGVPARSPSPTPPPETIPGDMSFGEAMRGLVRNLRYGIEYASWLREKYGDIYRIRFIGLPIVVVWDAEEIHKILRNDEQVWSTALGWHELMFNGLDASRGNVGTLLSLDFDEHRVARKLVQPAFTLKAIEGYLDVADRIFSSTLAAWLERGSVDFKPEIRSLLARVAGQIFTGVEDPEEVALIDRALSDFWHGMMAVARNPWLSPTFRRSRNGLQTMLRKFVALVPARRTTGGADLFSHMCRNTDTGGLDDEAIVRVFLTILFGAFDTTSAGVTSMAYLLAKHPEWQQRLREEAVRVGSGPPDVAAMKNMKEHEWVWKETLRLMPVNGFVPRRALRDVKVGGFEVRAGTLVMPLNGGIGRHPKWWKEPTKFDPERFSPERAEDKQHPGIFNPFGAGAHACVGMQLANMEMKLLWHRVLTSCRFRLARDYEARHTFTPLGTVSGDVRLTLERLPA